MLTQTIHGSAHSIPLPSQSIHAIVTSPPYYGLRQYAGEQAVDWPALTYSPMHGLPALAVDAWRGALGAEPTLEAFIGHLVLCLREWWRILRDDGTCFVNLGDSYANDAKWGGRTGGKHVSGLHGASVGRARVATGLKPKDLMMAPARFALAAQADGWTVRADIIWAKSNPMPESVTDRPTKSHEYIFLLTKAPRYYYDADAIREPAQDWGSRERKIGQSFTVGVMPNGQPHKGLRDGDFSERGRNRRSVWTVATHPYAGAHFATFPPALIEPCILAGTSAHGCCSECGAPWERVVEKSGGNWDERKANGAPTRYGMNITDYGGSVSTTTGWRPTCDCNAATVPATVLDPFVGSGTTLQVATQLGRRSVGVDISQEYLERLVPDRVAGTQIEMNW